MTDTTTPVTPVTPPAQDLQINLEDAPKAVEIVTPKIDTPELDLSLDLNLPEVPKNDDRLKAEDQKNTVAEQKVEETPLVMETPVEQPAPVIENLFAETPVTATETPTIEETLPKIPDIEVPTQEIIPSTSIEEIPATPKEEVQEVIVEPTTLKEDMNIINELETHASAGGLSPEATTDTKPAPVAETPKTFDLDAMFGVPTESHPETKGNPAQLDKGGNEGVFGTQAIQPETPVEQKTETPKIQPMPTTPAEPMQAPAFTIPTTQQAPVQAMPQVNIPEHKKTAGVKALLFVVLFAALGFTTYFILQTMYPVEFGKMFGGGDTTQMHASEEVIPEVTGAVEEITGTVEEITGEVIDTPVPEISGDVTDFGELNDLGTPTTEMTSEETDLSKLADYVNKGNDLREQGKELNNNIIIKYGLYISKKATDILESIAKGEKIDNLTGYFAQFDQYIQQLETLLGSTTTPELPSSPSQIPNASEETTEVPTPAPEATSE